MSLLAAPGPRVAAGQLRRPAATGRAGVSSRERTPFWWFLVLSTGVGLATTAVFFIVGASVMPWFPGLTLLAACGLIPMRSGRSRNAAFSRLSARLALLGIPAVVVSWWPLDDPHPIGGTTEAAMLAAGLPERWSARPGRRRVRRRPAARTAAGGACSAALLALEPFRDRLAKLISARRRK